VVREEGADMSERATAYHEAGHAVVAQALGRAVKSVTIVGDDEVTGRCIHPPVGDWFRPNIKVDGRARRLTDTTIMSSWAGTLAQEREGSSTAEELEAEAANDRDGLVDLALRFTGGNVYETDSYIEWLRRRTVGLLDRFDIWPAIEAVAEALLVERTLSGRRVRQVVSESLDAPQS
jgi:hypothetical protein